MRENEMIKGERERSIKKDTCKWTVGGEIQKQE